MNQVTRTLVFVLISLTLLGAGGLGAQWLWMATHHRYASPETGAFYGYVSGSFSGIDHKIYTFSFKGQSPRHWFWKPPDNFRYSMLEIHWSGEDSEGAATVRLPSLSYQSSNSAGVLSDALLVKWLLGNTNTASDEDFASVHFLHGLLTAAGHGELPRPSHDGHSFVTPALGSMQHFQLGYGIGWPVYVWIGVWMVAIVGYSMSQWQNCHLPSPRRGGQ